MVSCCLLKNNCWFIHMALICALNRFTLHSRPAWCDKSPATRDCPLTCHAKFRGMGPLVYPTSQYITPGMSVKTFIIFTRETDSGLYKHFWKFKEIGLQPTVQARILVKQDFWRLRFDYGLTRKNFWQCLNDWHNWQWFPAHLEPSIMSLLHNV